MKLYLVRNKEGKFFRAVGYGGSGGNWVSEMDKAKFYTKGGQASARVTWFFRNYPQFGCPEILEFDLDVRSATVLNMEEVTLKKIKKSKEKELERQKAARAYTIRLLEREQTMLQARLEKVRQINS